MWVIYEKIKSSFDGNIEENRGRFESKESRAKSIPMKTCSCLNPSQIYMWEI